MGNPFRSFWAVAGLLACSVSAAAGIGSAATIGDLHVDLHRELDSSGVETRSTQAARELLDRFFYGQGEGVHGRSSASSVDAREGARALMVILGRYPLGKDVDPSISGLRRFTYAEFLRLGGAP